MANGRPRILASQRDWFTLRGSMRLIGNIFDRNCGYVLLLKWLLHSLTLMTNLSIGVIAGWRVSASFEIDEDLALQVSAWGAIDERVATVALYMIFALAYGSNNADKRSWDTLTPQQLRELKLRLFVLVVVELARALVGGPKRTSHFSDQI